MPYPTVDLTKIRTYRLGQRRNLVTLADLISPDAPPPPFDNPELAEVAGRIVAARRAGRPVIWMIGAHVVKCGLSLILGDLLRRGVITHLATNGAGSIHDFELALIGETSEDVATSIEDGTFGMVEETGALMNQAIRAGARDGLGYGEALGRFIAEDERFAHRAVSLFWTAYQLGVPATVHASIGTDIIHQHPAVDFGALGWASGQDFKVYCASVAELEGGVFCNFGSSVTGPEVFLKALSVARNLGHRVERITTANFDLVDLGDYRRPVGMDHPDYYYRPRKNIVLRPTSLGGRGFHVTGDHVATIPNLYHLIRQGLGDAALPVENRRTGTAPLSPAVQTILDDLTARRPELADAAGDLARAFRVIAGCLERGGTLFLCGNGGSLADALHISAELLKGYAGRRPFPGRLRPRFADLPAGEVLIANLEPGLRAHVLGANLSLQTAVQNDYPVRTLSFAQELFALARPGDVLLGISTSGNAENVWYAATTARALGLTVIVLTGQSGGRLASLADVTIRAPATRTDRVQELHLPLYHALCEMLEENLVQFV
jgi:phosphoheptose isomerase